MSIKHVIVSLTLLVAGLLVSPSLHAKCAMPTPDATLTEQSPLAGCLQIETDTYAGMAELVIRNDCDQEAVVERVNCSNCDEEALNLEAGKESRLEVPSATGETLTSDYHWTLGGESGSFTVSTETAGLEQCNDTQITVENGCGGCSSTGDGLPTSWLVALLVGSLWVRRRVV